jgi:hypothetical protein
MVRPYVTHHIARRAMKLLTISRNRFGVLDDAIVDLRHPFGQAPHALELFFQKGPVEIGHGKRHPASNG